MYAESPVSVSRGRVKLHGEELTGARYSGWFVFPSRLPDAPQLCLLFDTGETGARLLEALMVSWRGADQKAGIFEQDPSREEGWREIR